MKPIWICQQVLMLVRLLASQWGVETGPLPSGAGWNRLYILLEALSFLRQAHKGARVILGRCPWTVRSDVSACSSLKRPRLRHGWERAQRGLTGVLSRWESLLGVWVGDVEVEARKKGVMIEGAIWSFCRWKTTGNFQLWSGLPCSNIFNRMSWLLWELSEKDKVKKQETS